MPDPSNLKEPKEYLPEIAKKQTETTLNMQHVPLDPETWKIENYRKFLQLRRIDLAQCMNDFIKIKAAL